MGVLAVSTDPSGEPGQHQSPLIVGPVGVSYPTGRTIIVRPVRVTRNDILQKQPQNKDPARNMTESCHVLAHVHMHMHGMHAAACVRSRTAIADSQIDPALLPAALVRSSNSVFATPPPGSATAIRGGRSRGASASSRWSLCSRLCSVCCSAAARAIAARGTATSLVACSHRGSSCRCGRRPLRSALVARHRRPARLLRLHRVACGCLSFSSLARALARFAQALLPQRGHHASSVGQKGVRTAH